MNLNISNILQKGEGISVEFKKAKNKLPENLFETLCAFLNRNGGNVLLGILDDGTVEGVNSDVAEQMKKDIANLCNNPQKLFPTFLLDIEIIEYDGKVYDRNADGDFELRTDEQIKQCYIRKSNAYSENTIYPYLYESDFVHGLVQRVRKVIKINYINTQRIHKRLSNDFCYL